jgi:hypothetical protein
MASALQAVPSGMAISSGFSAVRDGGRSDSIGNRRLQ